jgi:hypothetical protein
MFGFLNSTVLLAAVAALIPLLIHLFSRRRVKLVEFSSLRHLKEMQKHRLRRLKIRQWLLLALRMLIVLVAVLAFARPTMREGTIGSHAAVAAVVIFDNSASMDRAVADGNLLELARARTRQLIETFTPSDRVALIPLDRGEVYTSQGLASPAVALAELDRITRGSAPARLQPALETAIDLLSSAASMNRELYLVSDRQRFLLPENELLREQTWPLCLVEVPLEEVDNLGITELNFGGQLLHPGHDFDIVATISNYGSRDSEERIASLYLDGRRVAQTDFSVASASETSVRFTRSVAGTGFHSGFVELSDDRFAPDNRYYFSFRIPDQANVLIIDGDPVTALLTLALTPDATAQYWSVKTARPEELAGVGFHDYQVVVLCGAPLLAEPQIRRLQAYVRRGGSLLVTYGPDTDITQFNLAWSEVTGVSYDSPIRRAFSRAGYYSLEQIDQTHPIFLPFQFEQGRPPEVKFFTLPQLKAEESAAILMRFTGGQPALVETRFGQGRVLTFTGPIGPDFSDLTSHGFFVPFVSRTVEYLASDLTSLDIRLFAGQNLNRSLPAGQLTGLDIALIAPDSGVTRLAPEDSDGALVVSTGIIDQPGIFHLLSRDREIDRFAVNIDPAECDLTAVDDDQLVKALGRDDYRLLNWNDSPAEALSRFRVGRELWQIFLWAAAVLLAVEMLLGRRPSEE